MEQKVKNSEYRETLEGQLEELEAMAESHYSMYIVTGSFNAEGNDRMYNISELYEQICREYRWLLKENKDGTEE